MSPSLSEEQMEPQVEYASVKFLLKQVYAAHTATVKELEAKIKDLEKQLEISKRSINNSSEKQYCTRCKEMQAAYANCKDEYKNIVTEQAKKLEYLEQKFAALEGEHLGYTKGNENCGQKTSEIPDKISPTVNVTSEKPDSDKESLWQTDTFETGKLERNLQNCVFRDVGSLKFQDSVLVSSDHSFEDAILVPDTDDCVEDISTPTGNSKKEIEKLKNTSNLTSIHKQLNGKDNDDIENIGKSPRKSISKKRGLSELSVNSFQSSKRCSLNTDTRNNHNETNQNSSVNDNEIVKLKKKCALKETKISQKEVSSGWAENFSDFGSDVSKASSPSLLATKVAEKEQHKAIILSDGEDFQVISEKIVDESKSWKTCEKRKKNNSALKFIKSTSRYKMTLETANNNHKKRNYKQTILSKSIFLSNKTKKKNNINASSNNGSSGEVKQKELEPFSSEEETLINETRAKKILLEDAENHNANDELRVESNFTDSTYLPVDYVPAAPIGAPTCDVETYCPMDYLAVENSPEAGKDEEKSEDLIQNFVACKEGPKLDENSLNKKDDDDAVVVEVMLDSFDKVPEPENPAYKFKEDPVRNKQKRKQLTGYGCKECEKYYSDLSEEEKKKRMQQCSRHRAKYVPPATPEHFWELDFPDTAECKARGYLDETQKVTLKTRRRRPLQ